MSRRPIRPKLTGANPRARKELADIAAGRFPPAPAEPWCTEEEYQAYLAETERGFAALGFKKLRGGSK